MVGMTGLEMNRVGMMGLGMTGRGMNRAGMTGLEMTGLGMNRVGMTGLEMNKHLLFLTIALLLVAGCSTSPQIDGNGVLETGRIATIDKLEIYHFHGTNQCYSCKTVGAYAEETVNTYFADEVASGKIVFGHINGDLPENKELVLTYGATGSSLWLGTYSKDGRFSAEQNVNVWYKISNKAEYMTYLKGVIEQKLAGT